MGDRADDTAYWNVNVPESQRTEECPDFLRNLNPKDLGIISTPDTDYHVMTWEEVRETAKICLGRFQRVPSELRRYKAFTFKLAQDYGSVTNFILNERLGWSLPIQPKAEPFQCPDDFKILYNDWPYGIDPKIVHLVVWTKFSLDEEPATGELTSQARHEMEKFVRETFLPHIDSAKVSS